jgi:hypothetical protein
MTEASRQPKDKNYNLITVLYQSSDNVESLKTYVQDARADGDQELAEFFEVYKRLEGDEEAQICGWPGRGARTDPRLQPGPSPGAG